MEESLTLSICQFDFRNSNILIHFNRQVIGVKCKNATVCHKVQHYKEIEDYPCKSFLSSIGREEVL